ncbi:MAG: hypothetical protein WDA21_02390 [Bacilli bacterium]
MKKIKNKIKIICICIFPLLLSGCNVDYSINISEDGTIFESTNWLLNFSELNDDVSKYLYQKEAEILYNEWIFNLDYYDYDINQFNKYEKEYINNEDQVGMNINNRYDNLDEYKKISSINFFADVLKTRTTSNKFIIDISLDNTLFPSDFIFITPEKINVTITAPFDVIETNAQSIDENTNTYKWTIDPNGKETQVRIVFDKNTGTVFANKNKTILGIIIGIVLSVIVIVIFRYKRYNSSMK